MLPNIEGFFFHFNVFQLPGVKICSFSEDYELKEVSDISRNILQMFHLEIPQCRRKNALFIESLRCVMFG